MKHAVPLAALAVFACAGLRADFSYEQTTQMTGGMLQSLSFMSKQMREPIRSTVLLKGDRMAHINPNSASIIDLGAETITEINFQKKTYSVMTFAQMAEMLKAAEAKSKSKEQPQAEWTVKASVKETGQNQTVNGMNAREAILTIEFEGTDPKTNQKAIMMTMTSDMWLAPSVPGYEEIQRFYQRMARKLNWMPGASPMMGGGQQGRGMAAMVQEAAKLKGVPVRQLVKMNLAGGMPQGEGAEGQAEPQPQQQQQQQQQVETEKPSVGGALGRLGGRFGGLGGLGRKKQPPQEQPAPAESSSQPAQQQRGPGGPSSMMETTTDSSGFSSAPVDGSKFEIPAGFKRVESQSLKGR